MNLNEKIMGIIKKVSEKLVSKKKEVVKEVAAKKEKVVEGDKNVGDPFLGMGVKFHPSEETIVNLGLSKKVEYEGKVVLVLDGVGIMKVSVLGLEPRIFICKKANDKSIDMAVDNSWE